MSTYSIVADGLSFTFESNRPLPCQIEMGESIKIRWNGKDYLLVAPISILLLVLDVTPVIEITEEDIGEFLVAVMASENGEG